MLIGKGGRANDGNGHFSLPQGSMGPDRVSGGGEAGPDEFLKFR
jgi:hypothetical protein